MQMALRVALLLSAVALAAAATATGPGQGPPQQPPKLAVDTLFKPTHQFKPLRVLGFFPFNGFSHFQMLKGVMLALAKKGHHVTTVTPFKIKEAVANYRQIDVSDQFPSLVNRFQFEFASEHLGSRANPFKQIRSMMTFGGEELCRKSFSHPKLQDIYTGKQQYDVIFISMFLSDCLLAIGHKLKIPTVAVSTAANFLWTADFTGDVDNPAFYETMFLPPSKDKLSTFWRRLENTRLYVEGKLAYWWYSTRPCEAVMREFYGEDVPSLAELKRNVSLAIGNSHDILVGPKAMVPRFLPVAGIHLTQPDLSKVPKEIATFLDSATNGVLYFTLGSLVRSDSLPPRIMKALTGAFERLKPLRILWKYESSAEQARQAGVPDNVMVSSWMPQMEILSHPNVKGFLTHGGLMGSLEALYNGVPMAGIPMFGDQVANVEKFEALGIAVALDHRTIDEEKVYQAVKKIISDPEIRGNIADLSFRFRDRAVAPGDAVVWWTEYVVRHGGAPYLEAPTSSMPFYQYLLLDVVAAVAITLLAGIYLAIKLTSLLFRAIFKKTSSSRKKKD